MGTASTRIYPLISVYRFPDALTDELSRCTRNPQTFGKPAISNQLCLCLFIEILGFSRFAQIFTYFHIFSRVARETVDFNPRIQPGTPLRHVVTHERRQTIC